jgi:hypothetical protein
MGGLSLFECCLASDGALTSRLSYYLILLHRRGGSVQEKALAVGKRKKLSEAKAGSSAFTAQSRLRQRRVDAGEHDVTHARRSIHHPW